MNKSIKILCAILMIIAGICLITGFVLLVLNFIYDGMPWYLILFSIGVVLNLISAIINFVTIKKSKNRKQ